MDDLDVIFRTLSPRLFNDLKPLVLQPVRVIKKSLNVVLVMEIRNLNCNDFNITQHHFDFSLTAEKDLTSEVLKHEVSMRNILSSILQAETRWRHQKHLE